MNAFRWRVLVVDDDEAILSSICCALTHRGYDVIAARDGTEALARVERDVPHLVVLDVVMPRRSGLAVLERISRHQNRSPHVILLSGSDHQRHRAFAAARGVAAFLSKPFDMDDLVERVDAILQA